MNRVDINDAIDHYFELAEVIHNYFAYREDWVTIPLDDQRHCEWFLIEDENGGGHCVYSDKVLTVESVTAGEEIYSGLIYTQRFLPKWVYRAAELTLVSVNTQVDGNKFLMIFDNAKERDQKELKKAYAAKWGSL